MNGLSDIDTSKATEHLKNILNVGRSDSDSVKVNQLLSNGNMNTPVGDIHFVNENAYQQIDLKGDSDGNISIYGTDVHVFSSPLHHDLNCNKVIIDNLVDYGWEHKCYPGRLISVHLSKKYLAYALRGSNSNHGFVRVIKYKTNCHTLIRGFRGGAKDLAFAHSTFQVLLGCVDEIGELSVYAIHDDTSSGLVIEPLLRIIRPAETIPSNYHQITWCPYVPEDTIDSNAPCSDDTTTLLVVTHNEKAEIYNVDIVTKECGRGNTITVDKIKTGVQIISEHTAPITSATFSPDGIAVATASLDGDVKFFQVNIPDTEPPKCLHQWTPHEKKPLSSLFFLDNHENAAPDVQFWKFAITGANNNQEIKLWSCETWSCLQTIRFSHCPSDDVLPCIKAELDLSANYLFLSDISRKVFYILYIHHDTTTGQVFITSLSEYAVKYPVLSLAIFDISPHKLKPLSGKYTNKDEEEEEDEDEEEEEKDEDIDEESDDVGKKALSYLIKFFWINTKSLQNCRIFYNLKSSSPLQSLGSVSSSQDSFVYRDGLSDLSADNNDAVNANISERDITPDKCVPSVGMSAVLTSPSSALTSSTLAPLAAHRPSSYTDILLTPRDFQRPSASLGNSEKLTCVEETSPIEGPDHVTQSDCITISPNVIPRRKSSQHSSNSSPSREVAEILSPNDILNCDQPDDSSASIITKKETESPSNNMLSKNIRESPGNIHIQQEYKQNEWPQAPDPTREYKMASRSDGDINLQHSRDQRMSARHNHSISPLVDQSSSLEREETNAVLHKLERSMETFSHALSSMTDVLLRQQQETQDIRNEMQEMRQQLKYINNSFQNISALDTSVSDKVEHIVSKNAVSEYGRLENLLNKRENSDKQRCEQQSSILSQNVITGVNSYLDKTFKQEMKTSVLPHMSHCIDTLVKQLHSEILRKLNDIDSNLKENELKNFKTKAFADNLSQSVAISLQAHIQNACKDVFQNAVVPSFDKSLQILFAQLNEIFVRGTSEYVQQLEKYSQTVTSNIDGAINKFEEKVQMLSKEIEEFLNQKSKENDYMLKQQTALIERVRQVVQEEVCKSIMEHPVSNAVVRSLSATPVPQSDPQINPQHLLHLVKQGQLNDAFQQALSAVDVQLVLFLCELVTPDQVFGATPCPLAQHVLLSLIHQLSGDLALKTEVKVRYIEDAITSLDINSPVTREHAGTVLSNLQHRCTLFLKQNPNHKLTRSLKRILLAVQSLIK